MMTICEAIAKEEGFGIPNGRATRNNNPGDLEWEPFAKAHGATRVEAVAPEKTARFAYFPNSQAGFAAMRELLSQHYAGMTIKQMLNKYAPPVENYVSAYLKNVCAWTGLSPDTVIDQYL